MYDWHQTPKTVTISIPLAYKIDSKKVDATIAKYFLKLNIPEMKIFKFFDLFHEIEIDSSSILIENNKILFYLTKIKEEKWPGLEYKSTNKEELKERRKIAEEDLNKRIANMRETADNKKKEFEKFVIDRSIKIEDDIRKELSEKKNFEKEQAESELYDFINDIENRKIPSNEDIVKSRTPSKENSQQENKYEDKDETHKINLRSNESNPGDERSFSIRDDEIDSHLKPSRKNTKKSNENVNESETENVKISTEKNKESESKAVNNMELATEIFDS